MSDSYTKIFRSSTTQSQRVGTGSEQMVEVVMLRKIFV